MDSTDKPAGPSRTVHCSDAIPWLKDCGILAGTAAVTSLPDVSEVNMKLPDWRAWFLNAVALVINAVPDNMPALFFQSDIKVDGRWIDKGSMVIRAAEDAGAHVLFHKIVCRRQPGLYSHGRPGYTHLLAVSKELRGPHELMIPDIIIDAGPLPWVRAMGVRACAQAVQFCKEHAQATTIVDPFCGVGTVLAVANHLGLNSIGVELSRKRAEQSRLLTLKTSEFQKPRAQGHPLGPIHPES